MSLSSDSWHVLCFLWFNFCSFRRKVGNSFAGQIPKGKSVLTQPASRMGSLGVKTTPWRSRGVGAGCGKVGAPIRPKPDCLDKAGDVSRLRVPLGNLLVTLS